MGHSGVVDNRAGFFIACQFLLGEGISDNVLTYLFSTFLIVSGYSNPIMHTKTGMSPTHKIIDKLCALQSAQ